MEGVKKAKSVANLSKRQNGTDDDAEDQSDLFVETRKEVSVNPRFYVSRKNGARAVSMFNINTAEEVETVKTSYKRPRIIRTLVNLTNGSSKAEVSAKQSADETDSSSRRQDDVIRVSRIPRISPEDEQPIPKTKRSRARTRSGPHLQEEVLSESSSEYNNEAGAAWFLASFRQNV
jgi:hypothetical protein